MPTTFTTLELVIQMVVEHLGIKNKSTVIPEANFTEDLQADSLDLIGLIMAMEDKFSVEISDEEAEGIHTIQEAVDFIDATKLKRAKLL